MNNYILFQGDIPTSLPIQLQEKYINDYKNGDLNARNKLIEHNIRLIISIIYEKFNNSMNDKQELFSVGILGLIDGVDSYDPVKGSKYPYYLSKCIENKILMYLRTYINNNKQILNDRFISSGKDQEEDFLNIIPSKINIEEDYISKVHNEQINTLLNGLTEIEKNIIIRRYGFYGYPIIPRNTIGKIYNMTGSNVALIEKKALKKIKDMYLTIEGIEKEEDKILLSDSDIKLINTCLSGISKSDRDIFNLYFNIDTNQVYSVNKLSELMNTKPNKINSLIKRLLKLIKDNKVISILLNRRKNSIKNSRIMGFYDYFSEYTKEEILEVFNELPDNNKKLIISLYGEDLNSVCINKVFDDNELDRIRRSIYKIINNLNNNKKLIKHS